MILYISCMATPYHICTSDLCGELSVTAFSAAKYRLEFGGVRQAPPVYFGRSIHPPSHTEKCSKVRWRKEWLGIIFFHSEFGSGWVVEYGVVTQALGSYSIYNALPTAEHLLMVNFSFIPQCRALVLEVEIQANCQTCSARHRGPRTQSRVTDANLDCGFVENALFHTDP